MITATELSYALLLASGGVESTPDAALHLQASLPVSAEMLQVTGPLTTGLDPVEPAETTAEDTADSAPDSADPAPYILAEPVLDTSSTVDEILDGPGPETDSDELSGNIIIVAADQDVAGDPLGRLNLETFEVAQKVDKALVEPVAKAYNSVLPEPVRDGLDNFTTNLTEPVNFLNFLLQGKIGKAFETLGRFAINTTIGIGGVLDVAKREPFHLPYRSNGFANTLGFYGVEPGAYLYLPIIGSTTVRDLVGDGLDTLILPSAIGKPFNKPTFTAPVFGIRALNRRFDFEDCYDNYVEDSPDPYGSNRDLYLAQRQRAIDILRGRVPDPLSGEGDVCVAVDDGSDDDDLEYSEQPSAGETAEESAIAEPEASN